MITVFTVVYNNYGKFIPQWIEYLKKQSLIPHIMIILGKNHGADLKYLKKNNIEYYIVKSDNMGKLRNVALDNMKTEWWLYFSVDDELLPHICKEIVESKADAVSLKFNVHNVDGSIIENCISPMMNTIDDIVNWKKFRWGGYVAVKNNKVRFNEDVEIPNILLHFELYKNGLKTIQSKGIAAICHRWEKSHGLRNKNTNMFKNMADIINGEVNKLTCL